MKKYKLPSTHEAFQNSTIYELTIEFYEDLFEKDSKELLRAGKNEDGEFVFEETGDPLIDKWEKEIAQGITPDLTEGMNSEARAQLVRERELARAYPDIAEEILGINDDIFDAHPMYRPKTVQVGSDEDKQLRKDLLGS